MSTSTPTLLRHADVVARMKEAITGREDYVNAVPATEDDPRVLEGELEVGEFPECRYLEDDGTPSCIVGQAFAVELVEEGLTPGSSDNNSGVSAVFREFLFARYTVTDRAARFLATVQTLQDTGMAWGEAVRIAAERTEGYGDDAHEATSDIW